MTHFRSLGATLVWRPLQISFISSPNASARLPCAARKVGVKGEPPEADLHAERVVLVDFGLVAAREEVVEQRGSVAQALQRAVHKAGIACTASPRTISAGARRGEGLPRLFRPQIPRGWRGGSLLSRSLSRPKMLPRPPKKPFLSCGVRISAAALP